MTEGETFRNEDGWLLDPNEVEVPEPTPTALTHDYVARQWRKLMRDDIRLLSRIARQRKDYALRVPGRYSRQRTQRIFMREIAGLLEKGIAEAKKHRDYDVKALGALLLAQRAAELWLLESRRDPSMKRYLVEEYEDD